MTCGWKNPSDPIRLSEQGNTAQYILMCLNRKSSEEIIMVFFWQAPGPSPRGAAIIPHFTALHCYWTLLCYTLHYLHSTLPTLYTAYTLHCLARHCSGVMMTVHCTPHRVLCSVCTVPSLHCFALLCTTPHWIHYTTLEALHHTEYTTLDRTVEKQRVSV